MSPTTAASISNESKKTLKARVFEINKDIDQVNRDIEKTTKEKAPYDEKLLKLRAQKDALKIEKQKLQTDIGTGA